MRVGSLFGNASALAQTRDRAMQLGKVFAAHAGAFISRQKRNERTLGFCAVVLVHVFAIWILAISLRPTFVHPPEKEVPISVVVLGAVVAPHPTAQPQLEDPTLPVVPPPDVDIEQEQGPAAISPADISILLAPRPDPAHFNVPPNVPPAHAAAQGIKVVLRVLVKPDGAIGDAEIATSCGFGDLDAAAVSYVKDNWRFIPAMLGNRPVEDWTTIFVPFTTG